MGKVELGKIVTIKTGKLDANASSENGEFPFFTCSVNPLKISSYSYNCECVLVAGNGDLNVKYYDGKFDAYQRTYIIESNDKNILNVKYLYRFMSLYIRILRTQTIGGVIKYIKLGNLTQAIIPLPDVESQIKIVQILEKAESIILNRQSQIAALDELAQSMFLEMFGNPVLNSKNYPIEKLENIGVLNRGKSKHRPRNASQLLGGPYPLIQTGDVANSGLYIKEFKSTYSEIGLQQSKMWPKDTLCITIAANIAKTGILKFDACFPDSVVGFIPSTKISNIYMHYWFSFFQQILEAAAPESAQKNINLKILKDLKVTVPPPQLIEKFEEKVTAIIEYQEKLMEGLEKIQNLYNSLLHQAFHGELFQEE